MKKAMPKMPKGKGKAKGGKIKMEAGPFNAAKKGVLKSKRGGPHAAKKKIVKKK